MLDVVARRGYWHGSTDEPTSRSIALRAWALSAHQVLQQVPEDYHATIGRDELAQRIMADTDIHTEQPLGVWLDAALAPVVHVCLRNEEPPLVSLVVDKRTGYVGELYDEVLRADGHRPIEDVRAREMHASRARLACYVWAGSAPEDGGEPAALRSSSGTRAADRAPRAARTAAAPSRATSPRTTAPVKPVKREPAPPALCPRCFLALPATGICDNCD